MAESPSSAPRQVGWREVIVVAAVVVGIVLAVAALGIFVPPVGELFGRLPVAIVVLIGGTAWVLWRISRRPGDP